MIKDRRIRMTRGRYRGEFLDTLPTEYLKWVAENWNENSPIDKLVCEAADKEYQYRKENDLD